MKINNALQQNEWSVKPGRNEGKESHMSFKDLKQYLKGQEDLAKIRRMTERAFGKRRAHYHFEYLD